MLIILVVDVIAKHTTPPISINWNLRLSSFPTLSRLKRLGDEMPILLRILFNLLSVIMDMNNSCL
jgi:hypothetical protein